MESIKRELPFLQTLNGLIKDTNLDITQNILSHIPIEFVSSSRSVCKLWRSILRKPKSGFLFAISESETRYEEIQFFHGYSEEIINVDAPISYKTLARLDLGLGIFKNASAAKLTNNGPRYNPIIYGSCNGLVCCPVLTDDLRRVVYVCNPMTGEYVYLPEMEVSGLGVLGGFGYCRSTNKYKVIQFTYKGKSSMIIHVYTLGDGNGWRNKGVVRDVKYIRLAYANDAFYWLEYSKDDHWKLSVFDLADETIGGLRTPPFHDVVRGYVHVFSLSGFLCLYHLTVVSCVESEEDDFTVEEDARIDLWILTKEQKKKKKNVSYYPVDEDDDSNPWVWTMEFSITYRSEFPADYIIYQPFAITDDNQVLMWTNWEIGGFKGIVGFDRDGDTASRKVLWSDTFGCFQAAEVPHMNSFVSLKDLGEISARYIPNDNDFMHRSQRVRH